MDRLRVRAAAAAVLLLSFLGLGLGGAPGAAAIDASTARHDASAAWHDASTAQPDAATAAAPSVTVHNVYVAIASATATASDDTYASSLTQSAMGSVVQQLDAFYSAQTSGYERFQFVAYQQVALDTGCDSLDDISKAAAANSFGGRFKNGSNDAADRLLVVTVERCDGGYAGIGGGQEALSVVGVGSSFADNQGGLATVFHEIGHTLGLGHAYSGMCLSPSPDGLATQFSEKGPCVIEEYQDRLDIMGSAWNGATPNLSAPVRIAMGWMPAGSYLVDADAADLNTTISNLDGGSGLRAVQVVDPRSGTPYTFEFRTQTGYDSPSYEWMANLFPKSIPLGNGYSRAQFDGNPNVGEFRVLRPAEGTGCTSSCGTIALAVGPVAGSAQTRHQYLMPGDTFPVASGAFAVTLNSASSSAGAQFSVHFSAAEATTTRLSVPRAVHVGDRPKVAVSVTTASGYPLSVGKVSVYEGAKLLGSGAPGTITLAKLAPGPHQLLAVYTAPQTLLGSSSPSTTVVVAKAVAKVHAHARRSTTATRKVQVLVRVSSSIRRVTGPVELVRRGKVILKKRLTRHDHGRLTLHIPRSALMGRCVVKFLGNGEVGAARSKPVRAR